MKSDSNKNNLREFFINKRNGVSFDSYKAEAEKKITENFQSLAEYNDAENLLLYSALKKEISTDGIFYGTEKPVFYPKSYDMGKMEFFRVVSFEEMVCGKFKIKEPPCNIKYEEGKNDICVIPALSFDKKGFRLGYGGGYYDRFLSSFKGLKVGLCLSLFLSESLPRDEYDINADIIITEKGVIRV